jgi:ribonuclease HI
MAKSSGTRARGASKIAADGAKRATTQRPRERAAGSDRENSVNSRPDPIIVFCDGAAKGNPGPGGWGAIVVTPDQRVTELSGGEAHTTNNRMELSGAIGSLQHVADHGGPVVIYTDSTYVIQGITRWVWGWRKRGWKTAEGGDVLNRDLWERLAGLVGARARGSVDWRWVRGHVGTPGNERVDEIAVAFALQRSERLYDGPIDGYPRPILQVPDDTALPARPALPAIGARSKTPAHSYLSVVDGVPMRHLTWAECEARVKGRSGARFKKAASAADEPAILRGWGIDPDRL